MVEITVAEQNTEKRMKRNEDSPGDLCNNIKHTNICIIGAPGEEREKETEKIFEEIIAENMGKETVNQVQEAQKIPGRINPRRNTLRHTEIKLTKIKDRDKIKNNKGKMTNNIQGKFHQAISWFLNSNSICQKGVASHILSAEREEPTTKKILAGKTLLQIWWKIKS